MKRKGYEAEYAGKMKLIEDFGRDRVIKVAIAQSAPDYLCFERQITGWLIHAFEIKSTRRGKFDPKPHDKKQWHMFKQWSGTTGIPVIYMISTLKKEKINSLPITRRIWNELSLIEFGKKYVVKC